jgi:hypothetical protein
LHSTALPVARNAGIARRVTSMSPNTFVSNIARHSSIGVRSNDGCGASTPALFTSTRNSDGIANPSASVTSSGSTRSDPPAAAASSARPSPARGSRMVATTSNPRAASSSAVARPIPRLAPVMSAVPCASIPVPHPISRARRRR